MGHRQSVAESKAELGLQERKWTAKNMALESKDTLESKDVVPPDNEAKDEPLQQKKPLQEQPQTEQQVCLC